MTWQQFAPCASIGGDHWFPDQGENGDTAKAVCRTCPYRARCLAEALERGEKFGIWGGVNLYDHPVRRARRHRLGQVVAA